MDDMSGSRPGKRAKLSGFDPRVLVEARGSNILCGVLLASSRIKESPNERKTVTELPLVRSSERSSFKHCPQAWYWSYVDRLVPANEKADDRSFGTGIHLCMAEFYVPGMKRGKPLLDTWDEYCLMLEKAGKTASAKQNIPWDEEKWLDDYELGVDMLTAYGTKYQGDPSWEIIAREESFSAQISNKAIDVGTIDLVIRDHEDGKVKIVDHKSANRFPNPKYLILDDQPGSYLLVARTILVAKGLIGPKERVRDGIHNYLRKAKVDTRPLNPDGLATNKPKKEHYIAQRPDVFPATGMTVKDMEQMATDGDIVIYGEPSANQPQPTLKREYYFKTIKEQGRQMQRLLDDVSVMDMARKGDMPILKAPGTLCGWCDFYDLCALDEAAGDTDHMKKRMFRTRAPYHDHREGAENSKLSVSADEGLKYGSGT